MNNKKISAVCNCKKKSLRIAQNNQNNHGFLENTYNKNYDTDYSGIYDYDGSNPRDSLALEDSINNFNGLDEYVDYSSIDDEYNNILASLPRFELNNRLFNR